MDALGGLAAQPDEEAERIADGFGEDPENRGSPDTSWRFEVVDVRLVPVPGGAQSWAAYGTLVSEGVPRGLPASGISGTSCHWSARGGRYCASGPGLVVNWAIGAAELGA
jgi:hypothetical protein